MNTATQISRATNRRRQRHGHPGRAEWRDAPATRDQLEALRKIASETGHTFTTAINRGEAWRRIRQATSLLDDPLRLRCSPPWSSLNQERDAHR